MHIYQSIPFAKKYISTLLMSFFCLTLLAQAISTKPLILPEGTDFEDNVTISCTFPEGCAGGKYWINGGEFQAKQYNNPFNIDYSCRISVAGINEEGRIITDVVTRDINIIRVTPPYITATPKEGIRKESFYATRIKWNNVTTTDLLLDDFKEGKPRHGEPVVWITNKVGIPVAFNDYNGLWMNGLNEYKAYIYKDYEILTPGQYILHIAKGVFALDGVVYNEELQLQYEVNNGLSEPEFSPEPGEYTGPLTVSINYPTDGSAFYKFYKINGSKAKSYNEPIVITETSTIEAYGMDEDFMSSTGTVTATYVIKEAEAGKGTLDSPVMTRTENTISISATDGSNIKVWYNDNMNTAFFYASPFTVSENCKISCVAYTENAISKTIDMTVNDFPVDRGDMGEEILVTPSGLETVHLYGLSANGRWAVGFAGSDTSSKGFIWDLDADELKFQSTIFVNQLYDIADDGTAYGWRLLSTEVSEDMTDEDILWGICKDAIWTAQPKEMTVEGITPDGKLYGSVRNLPATYDFTTDSYTYYDLPDGGITTGKITTVSKASGYLGGYIVSNGKRYAAIWKDEHEVIEFNDCMVKGDISITDISPNGKWAIIGQDYRANLDTGVNEKLVSMSSRYHNTYNPEILHSIADDGTIFGSYDGSMMNYEQGSALVYTTDCRWRNVYDWIRDEKGENFIKDYYLSSIRGVSADHNTLLMHGIQNGMSAEDAFTHGILLKVNTKIAHLAPVSVNAQQMQGLEVVKVSWAAPRTNATDVSHYTLKRNGAVLATLPSTETAYYDQEVTSGETYTYCISATYNDGIESEDSHEAKVEYALQQYLPVRNLSLRQAGLCDIYLTWDAPFVTIPKLQYFNESSEWFAFGTDLYNSEWGIRIPASDLHVYEGMQIRTFQFLPSGPQQSYVINFYQGESDADTYDPTPFYSQEINPSDLNFGVVNVIELNEPQELPLGKDLYVAIYIESAGNVNMLGVSYEGFRSGYTDLCRIEGVFEQMLPISENSSSTTEIVLPIGIGICTENAYNGNVIRNYEVTDNGDHVGTTSSVKMILENMSEGKHDIAVSAIYRNGIASPQATICIDLKKREEAYTCIDDIDITVNSDNTARMMWAAPMDDDRNMLHWGDLNPMPGLEVYEGFEGFMAGSIYPVTMTQPFADDYEISEVFYCPLMNNASYQLSITDDLGNVFEEIEPESIEVGKINHVKLSNPIRVSPSVNYQLNVQAYGIFTGDIPLAYDSSGKWHSGYSNLFNYGFGYMPLSELISVGEHPNWLMGLVVRRREVSPLPLQGYNVYVDGQLQNNSILTDTSFTTAVMNKGQHSASVDVVYDDVHIVSGEVSTFTVGDGEGSAIEDLHAGNTTEKSEYDLQGRRIVSDRSGQKLFIITDRKLIMNK